jgi:glycerophosphoryl diester phosphodiesterase
MFAITSIFLGAFPLVLAVPFDQPATTIDELLALGRPVVIAHTGGEDAYPGSTMYGFTESVADGADMLDLNVVLAGDGTLVVQHDLTVDRTSDGTGDVADMTFEELHALDIAYWFTLDAAVDHDAAASEYLYRGVRTGEVAPPAGYTADDFGMPRLEDLLEAFPEVPLNVEIKDEGERGAVAADAVIELVRDRGRADSVVLSSFDDSVIEHVMATAPDIETSPGPLAAAEFFFDGTPLPDGQRILQLPPVYGDLEVLTPENVAAAHEAGYVVWVWPNDRDLENEEAYLDFLDQGIDGLNINQPAEAVAAVEAWIG